MSALDNQNPVQDAIVASLAAKLPARHVQRSLLLDYTLEDQARLKAGIVCVVSEGGGNFANYRGREGDLGSTNVRLVGFIQVEADAAPEETEKAELLLLAELLGWIHEPGNRALLAPVDAIYPGDWQQSKQLEHPYGWLTLALDVR